MQSKNNDNNNNYQKWFLIFGGGNQQYREAAYRLSSQAQKTNFFDKIECITDNMLFINNEFQD